MGFSCPLRINGYAYTDCFEQKITAAVGGMGTSGVCSAEFTFSIPHEDYWERTIPAAAEVVYDIGFTQPFFISNRTGGFLSSGKVSFKCFDRMIFTDKPFSAQQQTGSMTAEEAVIEIASQCGFGGFSLSVDVALPYIEIPVSKLNGQACRSILESISSAWCGYFRVSPDDSLCFVPFGAYTEHTYSPMYRTANKWGSSAKSSIGQVVLINGNKMYSAGEATDVFGTLRISTEYASQALADALLERMHGYSYNAWSCDKCFFEDIYSLPRMGDRIDVGAGNMNVINYMTILPTVNGIFVTCGRNEASENEYDYIGALSRNINSRIKDGELLGNRTMVTRYQGIIHLAPEESASAYSLNAPKTEFGYSAATAEGIVEFEGAMTDKVLPEIKVAEDLSEFECDYGGTVCGYVMDWDGDNVTLRKREAD